MKNLLSISILFIFLTAVMSCEKDDSFFYPCGKNGSPIDDWGQGDTIVPPAPSDSGGFDVRLHQWEDSIGKDIEI